MHDCAPRAETAPPSRTSAAAANTTVEILDSVSRAYHDCDAAGDQLIPCGPRHPHPHRRCLSLTLATTHRDSPWPTVMHNCLPLPTINHTIAYYHGSAVCVGLVFSIFPVSSAGT